MKAKKLLSLLSAGILAVSAMPVCANAEYVMGDVNQDGVFNNLDIEIINDYLNRVDIIEEEEFTLLKKYVDANNDGYVNTDDIILITRMYTNYDAEGKMGDVNHDGYVDCIDATMIQIYYAQLSSYKYDLYTEEEHANFKMYGNTFEDEFIDVADATAIRAFYAGNSAELVVKPNN